MQQARTSTKLPPGTTCYLPTRSGMHLRVRPARSEDAGLVADFFAALPIEDLRFRFLDSRKGVTADDLRTMLEVDHVRSEHLLAFDASSGKLAASLLWIADEGLETAEVAIAVGSEFRGHGIGYTLLAHALRLARASGIKRFRSIEDASNHDALAIEKSMGFRPCPERSAPGVVSMEAELA